MCVFWLVSRVQVWKVSELVNTWSWELNLGPFDARIKVTEQLSLQDLLTTQLPSFPVTHWSVADHHLLLILLTERMIHPSF